MTRCCIAATTAAMIGVSALAGCGAPAAVGSGTDASRMKIELLGFDGCPNTPELRGQLRAALGAMGRTRFEDVDLNSLPEGDPRRGWPAPTILVDGRDLFGMPAPVGGAMGCRVYPDGVPGADQIGAALRRRIPARGNQQP